MSFEITKIAELERQVAKLKEELRKSDDMNRTLSNKAGQLKSILDEIKEIPEFKHTFLTVMEQYQRYIKYGTKEGFTIEQLEQFEKWVNVLKALAKHEDQS